MSDLLQLQDISMSFGVVRALEAVNYSVGRGEVVALLGDSGAGKSTLIKNHLLRFQTDSERLFFDGKRGTSLLHMMRRRTGSYGLSGPFRLQERGRSRQRVFMGRKLDSQKIATQTGGTLACLWSRQSTSAVVAVRQQMHLH